MNRIDTVFDRLRAEGRLGLFPYLTAGFPEREATEPLAIGAVDAGADGLELGIPFSDPLADGATLQHANEVALRGGARLTWCIELLARLRGRLQVPLIPMTYYNPIHHYGVERFVADVVLAGADAVIVADLPSAEAVPLTEAAASHGLYVIQMVAPTSTAERLDEVGRTAKGFVYCVSLLGTTGARQNLSDRLPSFMARVRERVSQPLQVGFGISRPEHVASLRPYAQGVVVGGAIADLLAASPPGAREQELRTYISTLRAACGDAQPIASPRAGGG